MGVFDPAKGQPALELKIGGNKSKITMHVIHHSRFTTHHSPFTLLSESSRLDSFTKVLCQTPSRLATYTYVVALSLPRGTSSLQSQVDRFIFPD